MSYFPYQGYYYYTDSENFYHFNILAPYSPYNYTVQVISPVLPTVAATATIPTVTLQDVRKWVGALEGVVDDVNSALYPLFILLRDIAVTIVVYDLCGSDDIFKRTVAYYIGHYMELHLKALKDEQNKMTMSPQIKDETTEIEEKKISLLDNHFGNYRQTIYGQMFWTIYGNLHKFNIGYGVL